MIYSILATVWSLTLQQLVQVVMLLVRRTEYEEETSFSAANTQMHTSPVPSVYSCTSTQTIIHQDWEFLDSLGGDIG